MGVSKQKAQLKPVHGHKWKNKLRWLDTHLIRPVIIARHVPLAEMAGEIVTAQQIGVNPPVHGRAGLPPPRPADSPDSSVDTNPEVEFT